MPIITPGLTLNEVIHEYRHEGKVVYSPTTVMSCVATKLPGDDQEWETISGWDNSFTNDTAVAFGHALHKVAGYLAQGKQCTYDPVMELWVEQVRQCILNEPEFENVLPKDVHVEESRYCRIYDYAYTPDLWIAGNDGNPVVVLDWKTGEAFERHWWIQLGAYCESLAREFSMRKPPAAMIVQPSAGSYVTHRKSSTEMRVYFGQFLSILNTFRIGERI